MRERRTGTRKGAGTPDVSQEETRCKHEKGLAVIKFRESLSEKYVTEKKKKVHGVSQL